MERHAGGANLVAIYQLNGNISYQNPKWTHYLLDGMGDDWTHCLLFFLECQNFRTLVGREKELVAQSASIFERYFSSEEGEKFIIPLLHKETLANMNDAIQVRLTPSSLTRHLT
jgi:hypothetical protein